MDQLNRRDPSSTERLITLEQQLHYFRQDINKCFDELKEDLKEIKAQTTATNGRVTGLEKWKEHLAYSKEGLKDVVKPVWSILAPVLVGIITAFLVTQFITARAENNAPLRMYPHYDQNGVHDADCYWTGEGKPSCTPIQSTLKK